MAGKGLVICVKIWNYCLYSGVMYSIFSELFAKYNCTYCQEEINGLRVRCAECI